MTERQRELAKTLGRCTGHYPANIRQHNGKLFGATCISDDLTGDPCPRCKALLELEEDKEK